MNIMNYYEYNEGIEFYGLMPKVMEATSIKTIGENELEVIDFQETAWGGGGMSPEPETDYVDLGFPSGTLWAKHNIQDADGNELYFAWGDTQGYTSGQVGTDKNFTWNDYKFGPQTALTKYNGTDKLTVLEPEDDAATVNCGEEWRMPTKEDFDELTANTTTAFTEQNGVSGLLLTSKANNNTLFFPAVGGAADGRVIYIGDIGSCWSASFGIQGLDLALGFSFVDRFIGVGYTDRYRGCPVRPVRSNN